MTAPDPMALPAPPGLLVFLLGLTLVLHWACLGLLVATLWARIGAEWGRRRDYDIEQLHRASVLGISTTITAGVAPLLFVQVLYGKYIYSSSITIGYAWLAIVGYLLVGFYALYLSRWRWDKVGGPSTGSRMYLILAILMVFAIGFTYSWNHLQSLSATPWSGAVAHPLAARRLIGYGGAVLIASGVWAAWLGRMWRRDQLPPSGTRWALTAGGVLLLLWARVSDYAPSGVGQYAKEILIFSPVLAILAGAASLRRGVRSAIRWLATIAALGGLVGLVLQRESYRLHILGADHNPVASGVHMQWGPFLMFAIALVVGLGVLVWMLIQVRRTASGSHDAPA